MRNGDIRRRDGKKFRSVGDYVQDFKAFWHWWMKLNKKQSIEVQDICKDLDTSGEKPDWVYLTEEQIRKIADSAKYEYRVLIWFLFDTGMRAPTEVSNIKVSDFYNNFKELSIRPEISKTFGRRIKLMICSDLIKEYIKKNNLQGDDYLFDICPTVANRYLKRLGKILFGDKESLAGEKYSNLTLYDFRHCASCYWLPRYKSESALKYRFGWKTSDKIHYYSELLGMRDTITEDDVLLDVTKAEIEKELEKTKKDNLILCEKVESLEKDMSMIRGRLDILSAVAVKKETAIIQ
jgi:integrase